MDLDLEGPFFFPKSLPRGGIYFLMFLKLEGQFNIIGPISMALGEPDLRRVTNIKANVGRLLRKHLVMNRVINKLLNIYFYKG